MTPRISRKYSNRALKFVFNDFTSPYSILKEQSGLPFLYIQRIRLLLIEINEIYNLLGPMYLHSILIKQANVTSTRNSMGVVQPTCNTSTYGLSSARYYSKLWNELDKPLKRNLYRWKMLKEIFYPGLVQPVPARHVNYVF